MFLWVWLQIKLSKSLSVMRTRILLFEFLFQVSTVHTFCNPFDKVQIEQQKVLTQQAQHVKQAQCRLNKVHTDQGKRVAALKSATNAAERNAFTPKAILDAMFACSPHSFETYNLQTC
jgi:hypothetical protein